MEELERIFKHLQKLDPSSEVYGVVRKNYEGLLDALHSDMSACEEDLNGRLQRELKRAEMELDKQKLEASERDSRNRIRIAKTEAIFGLAKIALMIIGTLLAIALTGTLEESTILSTKCLSFTGSFLFFYGRNSKWNYMAIILYEKARMS